MIKIETEIAKYIYNFEDSKRIALSRKYPFLKQPIIFLRHKLRDIQNFFDFQSKYKRKKDFFDCVVARHQSVLRRRLGDSNPKLQEQKIINLKKAVQQLNGIVIQPNHIFSF